MRKLLFLLLTGFFFAASTPSALAREYGDCYFDCQEVPSSDRVLYHLGSATRAELDPREIRMLVWNIYKGGKPQFGSVFNTLIGSIRPDIVVLEEAAFTSKVLENIRTVRGFGWEMSANFLLAGGVPTGPMLGSAVVARSVRFHRTEDLEPVVKTPKTTLVVEYPLEGSHQTLLVAGIHGINFVSDEVFSRQITEVTRVLAAHSGPVVFAGDFNIWSPTRLEIVKQIVGSAGLERAPWELEGTDPIHSQLDDAFTRGVLIKAAQVWSDEVKNVGSDHPALFLKFSVAR